MWTSYQEKIIESSELMPISNFTVNRHCAIFMIIESRINFAPIIKKPASL
jgi:hypothetical protein